MEQRITKIETMFDEHRQILEKLNEALYGDGKPGLLSDFRRLEDRVADQRAEVAKIRDDLELKRRERKIDWQWLVTTAIAVGAVAAACIR